VVAADWGMLVNHITPHSRCGPDGPWSAGSIFEKIVQRTTLHHLTASRPVIREAKIRAI